ncbi:imidazole glycerol phosphate synthase subunit HisH [Clostridium sp. A1-XYC3]|uniref:Imidazole glycerol phosphate synthase subunit HisH n=1 Tax=Clostridium tanneri TaxID=3037988 RepID=A0ABU4JSU1_9CLOT|nr:imidazole glycerol phosphate synthase subunit HisH [Clostridium sp. A1-XYC3]MDW8801166.1 imidazole glycerol phosphate synthase subunit HisH [Clostridium sp. A1-XYC3]
MKVVISIIDYGMGNLRSVEKALEYIGEQVVITSDREEIEKSTGIILPGVGAFPDAIENLKSRELDMVLRTAVDKNKPMLGICLGMQLLFEESEEVSLNKGLGFLKGTVRRLYGGIKIPHMGWNSLKVERNCPILEDIEEGSYAYFVHSFYADVENKENLDAISFYGIDIPAVVSSGNLFGVQFHPEKSGDIGIQMLKNFVKLTK